MKFYIAGSFFFSIFNFVILRVLGAFVVQMLFFTALFGIKNDNRNIDKNILDIGLKIIIQIPLALNPGNLFRIRQLFLVPYFHITEKKNSCSRFGEF